MQIAYPIKILYKNKEFFTLYFDEEDILLFDKNIICYETKEKLFGKNNHIYNIDDSLTIYDFVNKVYNNPINYKQVLDKWNLLNTIAKMFKMYFEGDSNKRTYTYKYLFSCCFSIEKLPEEYNLPSKCINDINKVFKKQERFLSKLITNKIII